MIALLTVNDVQVIGLCCFVILISVIWPRTTTIGPVMFAWTGAAVGGLIAFLRHYDADRDRVNQDATLPSAFLGAFCGLVLGLAVRAAYLDGGRRRRIALEVIAGATLSAGVGLIHGWDFYRRTNDALGGALCCGLVCAIPGALLALIDALFVNLRPTAREEAGPNSTPRNEQPEA